MASLDERVMGFISDWEKRKTGELPAPDLRVTCQSCGVQVMGDNALRFTAKGLICGDCNREKGLGHTQS